MEPGDVAVQDASSVDAASVDVASVDVAQPDASAVDSGPPAQLSLSWARRVTGEYTAVTTVVATADGGAYAAGSFFGVARLGHGEAGQTDLSAEGSSDVFLARYDASGALVWARQIGGLGHDHAGALTVLSDGSAIVAGDFSGSATVNFGQASAVTLTGDIVDVFVARFLPDGTLAWAKNPSGPYYEYAWGLAARSDDSFYLVGVIDDVTTFGVGETHETTLPHTGNYDVFVARYNSDGSLSWARRAGGAGADAGGGVALLPDGSAMVTGTFEDSATFGPGEAAETVLQTQGGSDVFLARYLAQGDLDWVLQIGGAANDRSTQVAVRADGSALVSGYVEGGAIFGLGEVGETSPSFGGLVDDFLWQVNATGSFDWVRSTSASSYEYGRGVGVRPDGTGLFALRNYDSVTLGAGGVAPATLPAGVALAAFTAGGELSWARSVTGVGEVNELHSDALGRVTLGGSFAGSVVVGSNEGTSFSLDCPLPSYECGVVIRYAP